MESFLFYGSAEGPLTLNKDEVSEASFFSEEELEKLDIAYDHREILKKFFQMAIK